MATNKTSRDVMVTLAVIVAVVVTVLANLLADRKFTRIDLTKEGRYGIRAPFLHVLERLNDPEKGSKARMTYYISAQVPTWFEARKRDILDKLREIETAAGGKITLEVIDPTDNKELVKRLTEKGAQLQVQDVKKEAVSVMLLYSCLEITYADKPSTLLNGVGMAEDLEYLIASKILELTTIKKPILAVMAPPAPPQAAGRNMGRSAPSNGYEWLLEQRDDGMKFDFRNIDISEGNNIPDETALLILIRPKELSERQRYEIEKYLAGGGNVLLISSPFKLSSDYGWRSESVVTGLENYLKETGVNFNPDFILDNSNVRMPSKLDQRTGQVVYAKLPTFVRVLPDNVNQESVLTRLMPGLILPFPAQIRLVSEILKKNGLHETVLAKTSKQSWTMNFSPIVDVDGLANYDEDSQPYSGSKDVFVMLEGQFPFMFEGKPVPEWYKSVDGEAAKSKTPQMAAVSKKAGRLLICSAPDAFHAKYIFGSNLSQDMAGNPNLLTNIAESVSLGSDLIQLRSKRYETRTIDKLVGVENDRKRSTIKFALIGGIPLLVILFAILRSSMRREAQIRYERRFSATSGPSSFTS